MEELSSYSNYNHGMFVAMVTFNGHLLDVIIID